MNTLTTAPQVEALWQRLQDIKTRAALSASDLHPMQEALQSIEIAIEELRVADEELRQQNDELITSRRTAEIERQRYLDLFDFAPDCYIVTDQMGLIREANQATVTLF